MSRADIMNSVGPRAIGSVEWYTPPWIFDALSLNFNLDPASPGRAAAPWVPADLLYTKRDDGLARDWWGSVWLNPPYGRGIELWIDRMIRHNSGVALLPSQTAAAWCQRAVHSARAICFVKRRIPFLGPNRRPGYTPVAGSLLMAFGDPVFVEALRRSALGVVVTND